MPSDDDFGVVDQYEPHEMVFHRTFRNSGPRSDDCVFFTFTDGVDRGEAAKRHFYKLLVELASEGRILEPRSLLGDYLIRHWERLALVNVVLYDGSTGIT